MYSHQHLTDAELIRLYKSQGNVAVVGELYNRYMGMTYGVCLKYLKDREDSKDAVMQIFEKLHQSLKEHEVDNFKSWLYVTARNYCLMQLRAAKGKKNQDISITIVENESFQHLDDAPELETNLVKLEKCIDGLGLEQKHCVQLFFLQHKCYKEIMLLTGHDLGNVKSYIQNGKRNLKICMERNV